MPIEELRAKIDRLDARILDLIEERVETAKKIGKAKRRQGTDIHDPKREAEVIGRLTAKTKLNKSFVRGTFESIIEYCRKSE